jgi:hypothetical protein
MATPSMLIVPDRYKSGVLYSQLPESGAVDFDVTRATTAYRTNASGILEQVASGVPRLDYPAAGGCPSLLVEPAATNLLLRSEEFDDAYWSRGSGSSVVANQDIAPDGTLTADRVDSPVASGIRIDRVLTCTPSTVYTFSFYCKNIDKTIINYRVDTTAGGTIIPTTNYISQINTSTYTRIIVTFTTPPTNTELRVFIDSASSAGSFFVWGAQLETGSVATSYIPTVAATATRNADVISKTAVSGFIGQAFGTIYAEVDLRNLLSGGRIFAIGDGSTSNRIVLLLNTSSRIRALISSSSTIQADISTATLVSGTYKIALAYALNDIALYVNGVQIGTDTSATIPACPNVYLGTSEFDTTSQLNDRIRAAAIYTTRLSNSELAALTSL